jgi:hypothetical protein
MAERIQLPNGAFFPVKEGESKEQALAVAQQMYPDAFAAPVAAAPKQDTTGFKAAASAGATRLGGEFELLKGKLGLKSEAEAQKEYEAAQARAQQRFTPTEEGWADAPFQKFKETLGGSLPYMAAPAAAGLAALAAPVSVPVAAGLGLLGAGAVSTGQFTGSNLARQVETGKTLEEASLGKAAAAAVPQALIDTAAMALLPGVGKLFGSVGSKLTTEQAKAIASQTLGKAAMDYTAKTGMAMGREGITEVAQQTLERLQAGLNIADPEARKEYIESFIGGAVLGGAIAPVGRAFERSGAKTQAAKAEAEETRTARTAAAEQQRLAKEQQAAADEAKRSSVPYAMQVGQQYDTLLADFKARKTALKAPGKDATPVEKAEYADAQKALKDLNEQLKEVVPEYRRTAPIRKQAQEQARVAGMDPFDYMMEQAGEVTDRKIAPVEDTAYEDSGLAFRDPEAPAKPLSPEQYVADRIALAQDQLADVAPENYVEYLMQNPLMVDQVIKTRTKMPGLNRKETEFVLDSLKLQRRAQEEGRKARGLQGTAASQQRIEAVDAEEQAALDQAEADRQAAAAEAAREDSLGAERFALQKMRTAFAGSVKDEDVLSTKVDRLVEASQKRDEGPAPAGRVVAGTASTPVSNADILRAQLAYASATENRQRASDLKKQLDALNEPDNERAAGDLEFGNAAKEAGIEGRLSKQAMQANRVTRLSNAQLGAYDRLADFVQRVRENDQGVSDARKKTLLSATEKLKDNVAGLALSEVEARRAQAGLPEMSTAEKAKLVGQISQTLTELVERGAGIFKKPVERKAQMRGTKIVMGAGDAKPQPLGRRVFNNYEVASQALREQMRNDIDTVGGFVPSEPTAPPPERKPQRVTPLLKPQRPGFSDRSTEAQFADALRRATSDEDRTLLTELQNKFKNLSPLAQEDALDQVRNVELRMPAKAEGRLKDELDDLRSAGVSDTGQAELFPGDSEKGVTRTTPKRFLALLDSSKVQKLRAMLAEENRVLAFQEKRAATLAKKAADEAAKTEAAEQKILASNARTPVQKAKDALSRLVGPESKVTQALQISKEIKKKREETRSRLRSMLSEIENAELRAKKQVADIQELLSFTENKLQEVTAASEFGAAPSMNDLALWTQARDNQANELKKAQKTLTAVQKSLTAAQATQARIVEDHAKDTISNALVNEGAKAQRKYDAAKAALEKAQTEENAALRVLSAEQARKAAARPTTEEQVLERLGPNAKVVGTERIYRDTSDPRVQARVNALRKNIASAEVNYDNAKQEGNTAGMESALRRIEVYHASVNKILNNAPMRREAQMTDAEVQRQEEFDRAQDRTSDATVERFEESAGVRLKMAERRTIASVRNVKSNRIETQIKQESVAAQEARVRQEERTGDYPARALEELAKARAERAEVQRQIDYIDNNPAAPRSEAKQRQTAARTAAVAKRKDIDARLKELMATQKEVVAEARLDTKAEKELRKERNRMVRSAGRLQEAVDADTDAASGMGSLFRVSTVRGKGTTPERLQAIIEKMTADWKNVPTIVMAETYDALPDNIKAQAKADDVEGFIPGVYDSDTNVVYLVAENLPTDADIYATVAHEVAGHFGLRAMLGSDYAKTMDDIYAGNPAVRAQADAKMQRLQSLTKQTATEEVLADMAEQAPTPATRSALGKIINAIKNWFNKTFKGVKMSDEAVTQIVANAREYVVEGKGGRGGTAPTAAPSYRSKAAPATPALDALADKIITQPKTFKEKLGSNLALEAEMQGVDMRAGLRDVLKAGATGMGDDKLFTQAMYNVLKADQKMPLIYTVMSNGPLETYRDDKGLIGVRSTNKNSAKDVYEAVAALPGNDAARKDRLATAYMVAQRAENKGLEKLDVGALGVEQADLDAVLAEAKADPELRKGLEAVRTAYNAYNKGMIDFLATTGAIPKAVAKQLNEAGDYVPFYRVDSNGMAELVFSDDAMITIGDIRRQPYLAELKGGEQRILPLSEALPRNTILLTDKALTNMATKGVAYGLQSIGKGAGPVDPKTGTPTNKMPIQSGKGPADPRTIRFNQEPDPNDPKDTGERFLRVDTEGTLAEGVPSELLVKSLEGAHLPLPGFLKLAGRATDLLRAGVTRTPLYLARQLIREPMAAAFTGGLNYNAFTAVLKGGMKFVQMTRGNTDAEAKLLEKGLIQSGIFTGDVDDMGKFALQLAGNNQSALERLYAATDRAAIRADAATRSLVYENALDNGLSEVEADFMTMESMNFYKRGLSPSVQYASRMIPFFNAQIQGLNVLYKAATGKMPFEEQQQIKRKFFNNAVLMMASGIVYAMAMEDDETWRNARPRDKMTNFFIPLPGTDELLKLPIPFEAGYFYSLAVAAVDGMREQTDNKEQWAALKDLFINSIPGASSMGVPQLIKPLAEVWTNKNFMSGSEVESRRLQGLSTEERYNATTTELAKQMSKALPILSPIQIEHIVRGYFGVLPLAAAAAANGIFEGEGKGEKPEKRLSETALVGSAFQKKFGGADSDVVFRMAGDAMEARTTLNKMLNEGRRDDAIAYREKNRVELQSASAAGQYRQLVGRINADLRRTQERTDLTAAEKRVRIDKLDEAKQQAAQRFATMVRRIEGAGE